jgi:hypothetical protein
MSQGIDVESCSRRLVRKISNDHSNFYWRFVNFPKAPATSSPRSSAKAPSTQNRSAFFRKPARAATCCANSGKSLSFFATLDFLRDDSQSNSENKVSIGITLINIDGPRHLGPRQGIPKHFRVGFPGPNPPHIDRLTGKQFPALPDQTPIRISLPDSCRQACKKAGLAMDGEDTVE